MAILIRQNAIIRLVLCAILYSTHTVAAPLSSPRSSSAVPISESRSQLFRRQYYYYNNGLSTAAIVGIAVGISFLVLSIAVRCCFIANARSRQQARQQNMQSYQGTQMQNTQPNAWAEVRPQAENQDQSNTTEPSRYAGYYNGASDQNTMPNQPPQAHVAPGYSYDGGAARSDAPPYESAQVYQAPDNKNTGSPEIQYGK